MFGANRCVIVGVLVAGGMTTVFADRSRQPIEPTGPLVEPSHEPFYERADSFSDPVVLTEPPANVREAERNRRARRPAGDPKRPHGLNYDGVWKGLVAEWKDGAIEFTAPRAKPAEPMPPTSCRSVEPAPKHTDWRSGPHRVHDLTVTWFETSSGFGFVRMFAFTNDRGVTVPSRVIDRVELVSLLTDDEPSVYVLEEVATPARARQAKRRPLDGFERLGLDAVRRGENLVWTREAPTRMFGAIRARAHCLDCHANARRGDLLGAFTYYLNTTVDQLAVKSDLE
jgi:hypothetical protein